MRQESNENSECKLGGRRMLVTLKELLDQAKIEHKAVGAFNGTTLEAIRGIIQAAEELNCPVILQHAQSHDDIIDLEEIGPIMKYYAERAKVPVALHLDHGSSFERCVQALRLGFTSVMYDASAKSFEENAEETKEIVKIAHAVLSLIHISEPTRRTPISYAVFCLKKKKT